MWRDLMPAAKANVDMLMLMRHAARADPYHRVQSFLSENLA